MSRLRSLLFVSAAMSMSVAYTVACGDSNLAGIPYGSPDAGHEGGLIPGDSSTDTSDSSIPTGPENPDAASGAVRSVVAVGADFACLLAKDRTVWCWGRNDVGQLGRDPAATPSCGSFPCSPDLAKVEGLANIDRITAGDDFACAVDADGGAWCWGSNAKGQLGTSVGTTNFVPHKIIVNVVEISAGGAHVCVIETDGFVRCWGENTCNIFGGTDAIEAPKQFVLPVQHQISVGPDEICVTDTTAEVLCWGADHNGSLGHDLDTSPAQCNGVPFDPIPKHVQAMTTEIPLDRVLDVHVGLGVACARQDDGQVLCWGDNQLGGLGQGFADPISHPRAVEVPALKAVQLDVHGQTSCAIAEKLLLCWGDGRYGQLDSLGPDSGCNGQGCRALGYVIPNMTPVREVGTGAGSIATIKEDLSVFMWGRNDSSELALPQSDPANQACASGDICVPKPRQLTTVPDLF